MEVTRLKDLIKENEKKLSELEKNTHENKKAASKKKEKLSVQFKEPPTMLNEPKEETKKEVLSAKVMKDSETESDDITPEAVEGMKSYANALVTSFCETNEPAN